MVYLLPRTLCPPKPSYGALECRSQLIHSSRLRSGNSRPNVCGASRVGQTSAVSSPIVGFSRRPRLVVVGAVDDASQAGPQGAFDVDTLSDARRDLFDRIAPVYDELNDVLSVGMHRVWKRTAVKWSNAGEGGRVLDVCCGSGDLAMRLAEAVGPEGEVVALDFAVAQLENARQREAKLPLPWTRPSIQWVEGDAMQLPFEEKSFDAATLGYGLRNVKDIPTTLSELHRVLKPGCTAAVLDFNRPIDPTVSAVQDFFLDSLVVPIARANGVAEEYEYLKPSISRFPTGPEQEKLAMEAGFTMAVHYELMGGLMGCLVATV